MVVWAIIGTERRAADKSRCANPHNALLYGVKFPTYQGVSMNQFAINAFTREISELESAAFFQAQYEGKKPKEIMEDCDAVMNKGPKRNKQPAWDQIDS